MKTVLTLLENLTLAGSMATGAVLLARLALKKAPKVFSYLLWAVVLLRFLLPVGIPVELPMPQEPEPPAVEIRQEQEINIPAEPEISNEIQKPAAHTFTERKHISVSDLLFSLWLMGFLGMVLTGLISSIRFHRKLREGVLLRKNIYLADHLGSAYVVGLVKPRIYLDSQLSREEMRYILAHERTHIRHLDHLTRKMAYLGLCLHWFNPVAWLAFSLSQKDMEMCCDESTVWHLGTHLRKEYMKSLLSLSSGKHLSPAVAFGEGSTRSRIMNLVNFRKRSKGSTVLSLSLCLLTILLCACQPAEKLQIPSEVAVATSLTAEPTVPAVSDSKIITVKMPDWLTLEDHGDGSGTLYEGDLEIARIFRLEVTEEDLLEDTWAGETEITERIMPTITDQEMEWNSGSGHEYAYTCSEMGSGSDTFYHYIIGDQGILYDICFEDWVMSNKQEDVVRTLAGENIRNYLKEFRKRSADLSFKKNAEKYILFTRLYSDDGLTIENLNDSDFKILRDGVQIGGGELMPNYEDFSGRTIDEQIEAIAQRVRETYNLESWEKSTERVPNFFGLTFRKGGNTRYYVPIRSDIYQPFTVIWFDGSQVSMDQVKEIILSHRTVNQVER